VVARDRGTPRGILEHVSLGTLVRDLRHAHGWSQGDLATTLCLVSGRPTIGREEVHRWETGKVIPGRFWLGYLSKVLNVPLDVLTSEARLSRMNRRAFLSLSALTVAHGKLAAEVTASIAGGDAGPLTAVQTTHGTDLVIASFADHSSVRKLRRWMHDGDNPVLRVNAAGILAKTPDQDAAEQVTQVLAADAETRRLYTTAVIARVGALPWSTASKLAAGRVPSPRQAHFLASRFAHEALNPRDAGARWCSAVMLRDLSPLLNGPHSPGTLS
jgi:transcriptional regulator with XRE-family HTH domain